MWVKLGCLGPIAAGLGAVGTVIEIGQRWQGCESHLEPGSQAALSAALPVAFVLELAAVYLGGWTGGWIARKADFEPEARTFTELLSTAFAVLTVAVVLITLAGSGDTSCPTPP
ncbi:hypothetical protein ASE03_29140 [Kitasatospora sp. Root187]|nr:hypothetical protein ASC99_32230 [Kitasatospora sp. Root107]KRB68958.1 hypothetical protein ASE03_29140 [Kitasatospora sp. Root187]